MAKLTKPGGRIDPLLTLARLALPDAVKRGGQAPIVAIGVGLLYLVVGAVTTVPLLSLLFGIDDAPLRRNLLNLAAGATAIAWLFGHVVLRLPIVWLLDPAPFLRLPVGYRDLYRLRLTLSLVGYWLAALGPATLYLLATRTRGPTDLAVASAATAVSVLLLGRIGAILQLAADRAVDSLIGFASAFLLFAAAVQAGGQVIRVLDGEVELEAVIASLRGSELLAAIGYAPPGLLAAIFDSPGALQANALRLGALLLLLAAATWIEHRLLLRRCLSRPGGDDGTASPVLPLTGLLRRGRFPSAASLTLVEVECAFRAKGVKWAFAMCLGYATFATFDPLPGICVAALLTVMMLNGVRTEKPPPGCQVWRESLTLPLTAYALFRTPAKAPTVLAVPVGALATAIGFTAAGLQQWRSVALAAIFCAALLLLADGAYSLIQLYWPKRKRDSPELEPENLMASLVATLAMMGILTPVLLVWRLEERPGNGIPIAVVSAATLLAAALVWRISTARQRREIAARSHELLLGDPPR